MRELDDRAAKRNAERRVRLERLAAERARRDEAERSRLDAVSCVDGLEEG